MPSTRLERHRRHENRNRMIVFGAVIAAVVVFFMTIGVPVFVNLSGHASKLFGGQTTEESTGSLEFSDVEITDIPEATNSASLIIGGSVSNIDNLSIYLNGSVAEKIDVSGKSGFETRLDGLEDGSNEIYASGSLKGSKNVRESQKYTVMVSKDKPTVDIESPADNSSTPRDEIQILGKAGPSSADLTVKVNGSPTVLAAGGTFQATVRLKEGENRITVNVSDSAGNSEEKTITVKYEK